MNSINKVPNILPNVANIIPNVANKVTNGLNQFSNKNILPGGPKEFFTSNHLVARIAFVILVIFVFVILLQIGFRLLNSFLNYPTDPVLLNGTVDAEKLIVVAQNPTMLGAIPILRSDNQNDGLEFTWSIWIWIKTPPLNSNPVARPNQYKHIFNKGNDDIDSNGIATPNNAPGLYISPNYKDLVVIMNTFDIIKEEIVISDIPIEKWINVIIRCNQHKVDVFINGTLTKSYILKGIPKQNYDNVYIGLNGGFSGQVSLLQYFAYAIGTNKIQGIIDKGPSLKAIGKDIINTKANYLSFRWFY